MADNFNLRSFLTENKLTKNAQLLNEEVSQKQEVYYDDGLFEIQAKYPNVETAIQGVKEYLDSGNGLVTFDMWKEEINHLGFDGPCYFLVGPGEEPGQHPPLLVSVRDEDLITDPQIVAQYKAEDIDRELGEGGEQSIEEAQFLDSYDTPAAKKVHGQLRSIVDIFEKSYNEEVAELDAAIAAAEEETGTQVTPTERRVLQQQAQWIRTHDTEMEREGTENKKPIMKETKLTAKERRLVEMVNNAMGFSEGEENVDYTMGRQDDPNQLPNPAPELNIPEGDEMADETVIPEYRTIDELMKSIDHGTNKVAEEHKMQEMKKIAEALRMKAKKMEESEHAAHISPKDLKQLATDAAKLEKAAEKLKAAFDKKFNKKEKPATAPKAEKVEALQENKNTMENFDLRKFLVENKLTTSSRIVSELATAEDHIDRAAANQAIQKLNSMGARIDSMKGAELMKKLEATPYSQMFQVMATYFEDHNALEKVKQYMAGEGYPV